MKTYVLALLFLLLQVSLLAQESGTAIPINIGYYGAFGIQPGLKVGTELVLKEWNRGEEGNNKYAELYVSPQLGAFVYPLNNTNGVLNADIGYRWGNRDRRFYTAPSIGLGYLMSSQILSRQIDLGTGAVVEKNRELRHYFLPTINMELGKAGQDRWGWFVKGSFGRKLAPRRESEAFLALELGVRLLIQK